MSEAPYREYAPHASLVRHVECYWMARANLPAEEIQQSTVLPDGCMDILFGLGDRVSHAAEQLDGATLVGTMTRPVDVRHQGAIDLVGVRFRPGGARPFLDIVASEVTDLVTPLDELWGGTAFEIQERLAEAPTPEQRVAVLDSVLVERLRTTDREDDESVLATSELVAAHGGRVSVDALADATGLSRRQLERRFLATVGTPPKVAARVARFREAVGRLHDRPEWSLSRIALAGGYADQAHFTREFKALAGESPGRYRRRISERG